MKIIALHTDFRLYWPARLKQLHLDLSSCGDELYVVEIAGMGSPYAFEEKKTNQDISWCCLFPNKRVEDLDPKEAKEATMNKLSELNPDVVLSGPFAFYSGAAAIDWCKTNDKAVIIFDDSKIENVKRGFITNVVKKIFYSQIDAVLCPAPDWLPTYSYWGIKKEAVFFGLDVVDNDFWSNNQSMELNYQLPSKFFLCVGRLIPCKNFEIVINTFNEVSTRYNDIDLVFVGDGEMQSQLKEMTKDNMRIHFLPFLNQEELREVYHKAYALILPSLLETWGLVVNEAMAANLPVIVSFTCGCSTTLVKDYVNGYIFDPTNEEDLLNKMQLLLDAPMDQYIRMKQNNLSIINEWNLDRFSTGAIQAINYSSKNKRKFFYVFCKYLLRKWNGNYNPV